MRSAGALVVLSILLVISISFAVDVTDCDTLGAADYYVLPGGDISAATFITVDNVEDVSEGCVVIASDDITLNCDGNSILNRNGDADVAAIVINGSADTNYTNITIANCTVYDFEVGVYVYNASNSSVYNTTAYNTSYGIYVSHSSSVTVNQSSSYNNSFYGLYMLNSPNTIVDYPVEKWAFFDNRYDVVVNNTHDSAFVVNITETYFRNPDAVYDDVSIVSVDDVVSASSFYGLNWTTNGDPLPDSRISFINQYINIDYSGTVSIDFLKWHWLAGQVDPDGYNESQFELWASTGTWTLLNDTPDTTNNILGYTDLVPTHGVYAVLQSSSQCKVIDQGGVYNLYNDIVLDTDTRIDAFETTALDYACIKIATDNITLNCSGFDITGDQDISSTAGIAVNGSSDLQYINITIENCPSISGYFTHGIYIENASNTIIQNVTVHNNTDYGLYLYTLYNSQINESYAYNNTDSGFYLLNGENNTFTNNTAHTNANNGFYIFSESNRFVNNTAYTHSADGFYIGGNNNNLSNNSAYDNLNGFDIQASACNLTFNNAYNNSAGVMFNGGTGNTIFDTTLYNNTFIGLYLTSANLTTIANITMYNNNFDFYMNATSSDFDDGSLIFNATNLLFLNPYGTLANYTNLSINDTTNIDDEYSINWTTNSSSIPYAYAVFANKFINISAQVGLPTISSLIWHWDSSETTGYTAESFVLYKYDGSVWSQVLAQELGDFRFYVPSLDTFSEFGILQTSITDCTVLNASGSYELNNSISGAPHDASELGYISVACIKIASDDVVFDCKDNSITNDGTAESAGITVNGSSTVEYVNITVKNCPSISLYDYGVYLNNATNSTIENTTVHNSTFDGFWVYGSDYSIILNNTAYNNSYDGFDIEDSYYVNITNNTAYENNYYGFELSSYNSLMINNTAYSDLSGGFHISSTYTGNIIYNATAYDTPTAFEIDGSNNNLSGIIAYNSSTGISPDGGNNFLFNVESFNNSALGVYITTSNIFENITLYNNGFDVYVLTPVGEGPPPGFVYNVTDLLLLNDYGTFANYTNLSINDTVASSTGYTIDWTTNSSSLPSGYTSFANKYVNISADTGSPTINTIVWYWPDSEIAGYTTDSFELQSYNGSAWSAVPAQARQDFEISVNNLDTFSEFGILQANRPPNVTVPTLLPATAYTNNSLNATVTYTDAEATSGSILFIWYVNNSQVYNQTVSSIANGSVVIANLSQLNFSGGDIVNVTALADDGTNTSQTINSSQLTIQNTIPSLTTPTVFPNPALTNEMLYSNFTYTDDDNDPGNITVLWFINNTNLYNETFLEVANGTTVQSNLSVANTSRFSWVNLTAYVFDGGNNSVNVTSSNTINISAAPPNVTQPSIIPTTIGPTTDINATTNYTDIDIDVSTLVFIWYVDGSQVYNETIGNVVNGSQITVNLSSDNYTTGDYINISVQANDSFNQSAVIWSLTYIVGNTVPNVTQPTINPLTAYTYSTLNASTNYTDDDGQAGFVTFAWSVNGTEVYTETFFEVPNSTIVVSNLSTANFTRFSAVNVSVVAEDGQGSSPTKNSTNIVNISAAPPNVSTPTLLPATLFTTNNLNATITYTDYDGDAGTLNVSWYIGNTNVYNETISGVLNGSELVVNLTATYFFASDYVNISVITNDSYNVSQRFWSSTLFVQNSPPNVTQPTITPSVAYTNTTLQAITTVTDYDENQTTNVTFIWYVDNVNTYNDTITGVTNGSSVTGNLSALYHNSSGVVNLTIFSFDGQNNSQNFSSTNAITIQNTIPVVTIPTILPLTAYTNTSMNTSTNYTDANTHSANLTFMWYINNVNTFNQTVENVTNGSTYITSNISALYFNNTDEVNVSIIANDSLNNSETQYSSNKLTVQNSVPVLLTPSILPATVYTNTSLNTSTNYTDADTHSANLTFIWYIDNVNTFNQTVENVTNGSTYITSNISALYFNNTDEVNVSIIANDGNNNSETQYSSNKLTIQNTIPVVTISTILPLTAYTNTTLNASTNYTDADGLATDNTITFMWYVNNVNTFNQSMEGVTNGSTYITSNISSLYFNNTDLVNVSIFANDGENNSDTVYSSNTLTIQNTIPNLSAVIISPVPLYSSLTANATVNYSDADRDSGNLTFLWYVDSVNVYNQSITDLSNSSSTSSTLDATYYNASSLVNASVYATDSNGNISSTRSSNITVINSPINSVTVTPTSIYHNDYVSFTLNATNATEVNVSFATITLSLTNSTAEMWNYIRYQIPGTLAYGLHTVNFTASTGNASYSDISESFTILTYASSSSGSSPPPQTEEGDEDSDDTGEEDTDDTGDDSDDDTGDTGDDDTTTPPSGGNNGQSSSGSTGGTSGGTTSISSCSTDSDCAATQYCVNGVCAEVQRTSCGFLDNHNWIEYSCCSDIDCAPTYTCSAHSCVKRVVSLVLDSDVGRVGEKKDIVVKEGGKILANVTLKILTPDKKIITIRTDAQGKANIQLDSEGKYEIIMVDRGAELEKTSLTSFAKGRGFGTDNPVLIWIDEQKEKGTTLALILIIFGALGFYLYWRNKKPKKYYEYKPKTKKKK